MFRFVNEEEELKQYVTGLKESFTDFELFTFPNVFLN